MRRGLPQENAYDVVYRHALSNSGPYVAFGTTTGNLYLSEGRCSLPFHFALEHGDGDLDAILGNGILFGLQGFFQEGYGRLVSAIPEGARAGTAYAQVRIRKQGRQGFAEQGLLGSGKDAGAFVSDLLRVSRPQEAE